MEVTEAIRRLAIRSYPDHPVPDDVSDRLLGLVRRAPTGSGAPTRAQLFLAEAVASIQVFPGRGHGRPCRYPAAPSMDRHLAPPSGEAVALVAANKYP